MAHSHAVSRDGLGILALVPDDWAVPWQRRHQVLTRLASRVPVAWISPPFFWREWLVRRRRKKASPALAMLVDPRMLFVLSSAEGTPTVRMSRLLHRTVLRHRARRGAQWLRKRGCRSIELQIWFPEYADALDWGLHTSSSYHIDDEYSWSSSEQPLSPRERLLIERVDRVYVTSRKLLETKGGVNPRTMLSSNGVDFRAFSTRANAPADLSLIPRPRIGYIGVLKAQLDWDLLATLARRRSDWSFVFVGPARAHTPLRPLLARLARLPNVHFLGERSVVELPAYTQHVDVALLPYRRNVYSDAINPLKLYESLAAGVPIVGSRIPAVEAFGHVVSVADSPDDWIVKIEKALVEGTSPQRRAECQAAVKAFDWDAIAASLLPPT